MNTPQPTINWRDMETTALGNEYHLAQVGEAAIVHSNANLKEVRGSLLHLREQNDGWWSAPISGSATRPRVASAREGAGAAPPGACNA